MIRIYLGGYLNFYHPQRENWLEVTISPPTTLAEVLSDAGIPIKEVQLVSINGEVVDLEDAVIPEGDEVKVFSAVGGG